ncbi:MAG: T9SS type A sorting domain-containing protein [candidate division WOR-3 bacterium]|nr:MAG: T9SS type A sorting domain-containing protein [candidate division WOR-3 bacterium]
MRKLTVLLLVWVAFVLFPMPSLAAMIQVDMVNFAFVPDSLTVNQGDTVLWINQSAIVHTTTSGVNGIPDGYWNSGNMSPGDSFAFAFDSVGAFLYFCIPHWPLGMVGMITVNPVGVAEVESPISLNVRVDQNYPNPFNSSTTISYELRSPSTTEIVVYNTSGQFIKTLVSAYATPGSYSVMWDGRNDVGQEVPSGVYIYLVTIGNTTVSKKMLLFK